MALSRAERNVNNFAQNLGCGDERGRRMMFESVEGLRGLPAHPAGHAPDGSKPRESNTTRCLRAFGHPAVMHSP